MYLKAKKKEKKCFWITVMIGLNTRSVDLLLVTRGRALLETVALIRDGTLISDGMLIRNGMLIRDGTLIGDGMLIRDMTLIRDTTLIRDGTLVRNGTFIRDATHTRDEALAMQSGLQCSTSNLLIEQLELQTLSKVIDGFPEKKCLIPR